MNCQLASFVVVDIEPSISEILRQSVLERSERCCPMCANMVIIRMASLIILENTSRVGVEPSKRFLELSDRALLHRVCISRHSHDQAISHITSLFAHVDSIILILTPLTIDVGVV